MISEQESLNTKRKLYSVSLEMICVATPNAPQFKSIK